MSRSELRKVFDKFLNEYVIEKNNDFKGNVLAAFIRGNCCAPQIVRNAIGSTDEVYKIKGSVGQSTWVGVPWLAVMNTEITESAQRGVYVVYLLSEDGNTLYLTLNQGGKDVKESVGNKQIEAEKKLRKRASEFREMLERAPEFREMLDNKDFHSDDNIDLRTKGDLGRLYEAGTIFYREYKKGKIPDEERLQKDLQDTVKIYEHYKMEFKKNCK